MLSMNTYTREYVDGCRARIEAQLSTYTTLMSAANAQTGSKKSQLGNALAAFESQFFNNMVLVLDNPFVHRTRALEKKDGNPLNEVRVLFNSLLQNDGALLADKTIKLDPAKSVLGYGVGDEIRLNEASSAFFAEIERKYL